MEPAEFIFINEDFTSSNVAPSEMDHLLANGWRHFGTYFFRYSIAYHRNRYRIVIPLRIRLSEFNLSKSLRRIIKKNSDLVTVIRPTIVDDEKYRLFDRHSRRFLFGRPESLEHFLDRKAAYVPCPGKEVCVYSEAGELLAASFFDDAGESISAVYAMFDPRESRRSLGIYTLLLESEFAKEAGKRFHYLGYAYSGSSFYDYKKRFSGTERFDWRGGWDDYRPENEIKWPALEDH